MPGAYSPGNGFYETPELALAYLAQNPADDDELVTQQWVSDTFGHHLASCDWKRYALHIATDKFARPIGWCPPCGVLAQCLCLNEWVLIDNPTRRQVRALLSALGIKVQKEG